MHRPTRCLKMPSLSTVLWGLFVLSQPCSRVAEGSSSDGLSPFGGSASVEGKLVLGGLSTVGGSASPWVVSSEALPCCGVVCVFPITVLFLPMEPSEPEALPTGVGVRETVGVGLPSDIMIISGPCGGGG